VHKNRQFVPIYWKVIPQYTRGSGNHDTSYISSVLWWEIRCTILGCGKAHRNLRKLLEVFKQAYFAVHMLDMNLMTVYYLCPPYVTGQAIYIFMMWFLLLSSSFFPRLISAVGDWMSTILPHMVWPYSECRMHVWNMLRAARWKYSTQKIAKKSPSGHHPTTLSGYIFTTKACTDNRKKLSSSNIFSTFSHNRVNFGPLVLVALCNRADHYISSSFFFFLLLFYFLA